MFSQTERNLAAAYLDAKEYVILRGFASEIDWQADIANQPVTQQAFLRESAWAVLSSGMAERVVRRVFDSFSAAFFHWSSASMIVANESDCASKALGIFNHQAKISAILEIARAVNREGVNAIWRDVQETGPSCLERFPYIGPATSRHLAKNLGVATCKADRHLLRISHALGCSSPEVLCETVARVVAEPVQVIDIVFWRFATLNGRYLSMLNSAQVNKAENIALRRTLIA